MRSAEILYEKRAKTSCDGRVVKALDLKSNGVSPRRFEPCSQRWLTLVLLLVRSGKYCMLSLEDIFVVTVFKACRYKKQQPPRKLTKQ